jgi:transposase
MLLAEKRLAGNSKISSLPPAMDPNRTKTSKAKGKRKPGGQEGHSGTTLKQVSVPDEIKPLKVNRARLPPGEWKKAGFEKRQVF